MCTQASRRMSSLAQSLVILWGWYNVPHSRWAGGAGVGIRLKDTSKRNKRMEEESFFVRFFFQKDGNNGLM